MDSPLADLLRHNLWANLRLLDVCAGLDDAQLDASAPGTYGRIRDTLVHIFAAEEIYLTMFTGRKRENPLRAGEGFPAFEELRRRARSSGEELLQVATQVEASQVLQTTRRGRAARIPAGVLVVQAINHATEHRAHVATILSQLGIAPPSLDGWRYGEALGVVDPE